MRTTRIAVFLCSVSFAAAACAAEVRLQFDAAQTSVDFALASVLHTVHGDFKLRQGEVRFDPLAGTVRGEMVVDAASGKSGNDTRDGRMHKSILESMRFPEVVFSPSRFTGQFQAQQDSQLIVHGMLRLHGAEHEIDVPAKVHPQSGGYAVEAEFPVPYVAWGLKNPSTFLLKVGETVTIQIHATVRTMSEP